VIVQEEGAKRKDLSTKTFNHASLIENFAWKDSEGGEKAGMPMWTT